MKKRRLSLLLSMLIVFALAVSLVACSDACKDGNHTWDEGTVTTPATCTKEGVKTFVCTSCAQTKTESLPMIAHQLKTFAEKPATEMEDGYLAYYKCTACNKLFADAEGKHEIAKPTVIPALGSHDAPFADSAFNSFIISGSVLKPVALVTTETLADGSTDTYKATLWTLQRVTPVIVELTYKTDNGALTFYRDGEQVGNASIDGRQLSVDITVTEGDMTVDTTVYKLSVRLPERAEQIVWIPADTDLELAAQQIINSDYYDPDWEVTFDGNVVDMQDFSGLTMPDHDCELRATLPGQHVCDHVCPDCNKCMDPTCTDPACSDKCEGHPVTHTCESQCPDCGKCQDPDCDDPVCKDKCTCTTEEHTCTSQCEECHLCTDADCTDPACQPKCQGHTAPPDEGGDQPTETATLTIEYTDFNVIDDSQGSAYDKYAGVHTIDGIAVTVKDVIPETKLRTIQFSKKDNAKSRLGTLSLSGKYSKLYIRMDCSKAYSDSTLLTVSVGGVEVDSSAYSITHKDKSNVDPSTQCEITMTVTLDMTVSQLIEIKNNSSATFYCYEITFYTGEGSEGGDTPVQHKCGHVCPQCGGCLDSLCTDPACANKCEGHSVTPVDPSADKGTEKNPYTVAELFQIGTAMSGNYSAEQVYVIGYIVDAVTKSTSTGAYMFHISDTVGGTAQVCVWYAESDEVPYTNDRVTVYGYIQKYSKGSTVTIETSVSEDGVSSEHIITNITRGTSQITAQDGSGTHIQLDSERGQNGSQFTFRVTVDEGYTLSSVKVNGVEVSPSGNIYTAMVQGPTTVQATAIKVDSEDAFTVEVDFTKNFSTYAADWGDSYTNKTLSATTLGVTNVDFTVTMRASDQTKSANTALHGKPVVASKKTIEHVTISMNDGHIINSFTLNFSSTKSFVTLTLQYKVAGGDWTDVPGCGFRGLSKEENINNYTDLSAANLPDGVQEIRLEFQGNNDKNNQQICLLGFVMEVQ